MVRDIESSKIKRDVSISLVRITAMLSIILCHAFSENVKIAFLGQIFNAGVYTFLFLSGYLFGTKIIVNSKEWLKKRMIRIIIPMYVFLAFLFIIRAFILKNGFEIDKYLIYFFDLQGFLGTVKGAGHLWFLTAIGICYLITPILNILKVKIKYMTKVQCLMCISSLFLIQIFLSYIPIVTIGLYAGYILTYVVGYFYSYLNLNNESKYKLIIYSVITICGMAVRLIVKIRFDNTVLYNSIIVFYSQLLLGVWLFLIINYFKNIRVSKKAKKIIYYFDKLSFEMYIVHYMFFVGPFRVMGCTSSFVINLLIAFLLTYISAIILSKICGIIYKKIKL